MNDKYTRCIPPTVCNRCKDKSVYCVLHNIEIRHVLLVRYSGTVFTFFGSSLEMGLGLSNVDLCSNCYTSLDAQIASHLWKAYDKYIEDLPNTENIPLDEYRVAICDKLLGVDIVSTGNGFLIKRHRMKSVLDNWGDGNLIRSTFIPKHRLRPSTSQEVALFKSIYPDLEV